MAFFSRLRFSYLFRTVKNPGLLALLFVLLSGSSALATITLAAYLTSLPLLFPPLAPSAYILFRAPMSLEASPRNLICSHGAAVFIGLGALHLFNFLFPESGLLDPEMMSAGRVGAIAVAMGGISAFMIGFKASHPPAAATALIAATGYFDDAAKIMGLIAAALLLAVEGAFFNRVLGGLPYPLWHGDPEALQHYGPLAGIPQTGQSFWQRLTEDTFRRR